MKRIKKIASLLLALVMAMAMTLPAFAAEADPTYTLKIKTVANHTYKIYQLATGDISSDGNTLSNIEVGENAKTGTIVENIEGLKDKEGAELGDAAYALIDPDSEPIRTVTGDGEEKSATLPGGYYVVVDTFTNAGAAEGDSISRTMVQLVADAEITPKTITVEPDKKITGVNDDVNPNKPTDTNSAAIGDVITYRLAGSIPDMTGYTSFRYVLLDTASKGLEPKVKVGDVLTGGLGTRDSNSGVITPEAGREVKYRVNEVTKNTDGTTVVRLAVVNAISYANDTDKWFYVDIQATLTAEADVVKIPNTNKVKVIFSNVPGHDYKGDNDDFGPNDPEGTTVEVTVNTYTTELTLNKVDGANNAVLTGAEFKLESTNSKNVGYVTGQEYVLDNDGIWYKLADGAYTETEPTEETANKYASTTDKYILKNVDKTTYTEAQTEAQAFVDSNGKVVFTGLGIGDYKLTEVTTPDGYNTMAPIVFSIGWTKEGGFSLTMAKGTPDNMKLTLASDEDGKGTVLSSTIPNNKGSLLPSTGGIGTTIFYIVGAVLVIGAGVILVAKKRMSKEV